MAQQSYLAHSSNGRSAVVYLSVKTTAVPVNPKKNPMKAFLFILEKLHNEEQIKPGSSGEKRKSE